MKDCGTSWVIYWRDWPTAGMADCVGYQLAGLRDWLTAGTAGTAGLAGLADCRDCVGYQLAGHKEKHQTKKETGGRTGLPPAEARTYGQSD